MGVKRGLSHLGWNIGSDYRVLRKICGAKRDEVGGEWRRLHNEELQDLHSLPNIIRAIKSRRMRGVGHVHRTGLRFV
jgi:hypothetical protein